ncbi:hypothetical protein C8J57DRAFT_522822 [Mycena rebaudengoi]|nr:hypothetical protein C8J57DRAFT_522822 [Mycena rebaudengoi]
MASRRLSLLLLSNYRSARSRMLLLILVDLKKARDRFITEGGGDTCAGMRGLRGFFINRCHQYQRDLSTPPRQS